MTQEKRENVRINSVMLKNNKFTSLDGGVYSLPLLGGKFLKYDANTYSVYLGGNKGRTFLLAKEIIYVHQLRQLMEVLGKSFIEK